MKKLYVKIKPNTVLSTIPSIRSQKRLLISIDERWCEIFNNENPTFEAVIDENGRYTLRGPMVH